MSPSSSGSGAELAAAQQFRARLLGWMLLALILGYAGLVLPLPWRVVTALACLAGVSCAVVLVISALRSKDGKPVIQVISAVLGVACFAFFALSAGVELLFWDASVRFEDCLSSALTERAEAACISERESAILDSLPGAGIGQ